MRIIESIKTFGVAILIGVVGIGIFAYLGTQGNDIDTLESDIVTVEGLILDNKQILERIPESFDREGHQEEIESRTISAREIGEEMIKVDNTLTAFYKTSDPLPESEKEKAAMFQALDKAKEANTALTGASESDHIITWQLNPEWTLRLDSVITYQDTDRVPIVFSMTTKDGKQAGLIFATYDVARFSLTDISRHYTPDGLADEADIGGI